MRIKGYDGKTYRICRETDLTGLIDDIQREGSGLRYTGDDRNLKFSANGKTTTIGIESGFQWDGASIPGFAQWLIGKPTDKAFRVPSLVHDAGYEDRTKRVLHDVIFYYLLRELEQVPAWKAWLMYAAVRIGGHVYYAAETSRFWRGIKGILSRA